MNLTLLVPALTAIVGLALYYFANGKWTEVGRILFFVGILVLVATLASAHVALAVR
jgi:Na+/phosphate symporter